MKKIIFGFALLGLLAAIGLTGCKKKEADKPSAVPPLPTNAPPLR